MLITTRTTTFLLAALLAHPLNAWAMQPSANKLEEEEKSLPLLIDEEKGEAYPLFIQEEEEKEQEEEEEQDREDQKEDEEENRQNRYLANLDSAQRLMDGILPSSCWCGGCCCALISLFLVLTLFDELLSPEMKEELPDLSDSQVGPGG
ncbi:MAG: hypothetical protein AAF471_04200 [Myxococcota bacterium]